MGATLSTEVYYEFKFNPIEIRYESEFESFVYSEEYEFEIDFWPHAEEPQTRDHPGCEAYLEIESIKFKGVNITEEIEQLFPDLFEKIETECYEYMMNYDPSPY